MMKEKTSPATNLSAGLALHTIKENDGGEEHESIDNTAGNPGDDSRKTGQCDHRNSCKNQCRAGGAVPDICDRLRYLLCGYNELEESDHPRCSCGSNHPSISSDRTRAWTAGYGRQQTQILYPVVVAFNAEK